MYYTCVAANKYKKNHKVCLSFRYTLYEYIMFKRFMFKRKVNYAIVLQFMYIKCVIYELENKVCVIR